MVPTWNWLDSGTLGMSMDYAPKTPLDTVLSVEHR